MPPRPCRVKIVDEVKDEILRSADDGSWQPDEKPGWLCKTVGSTKVENWELLAAGAALLVVLILIAGGTAWQRRRRRRGQDASWCCCCCGCCGGGEQTETASMKERLMNGHYRGAIKTGYLQKQGHQRKNWKQRFFVLEQSVMLYYERPSDLQPKGTVRMDDITLALATEITGKPHCFGVFHPTRDPYYLVARNEAEMMKWVRAIRGDDKVGLVDFDVVSKLGQGNFGKVVLVKKKSANPKPGVGPKFYAMKILEKEKIIARKDVAHANAERRILQQIKHPFIVRLHYAFQTGEKLYMVMDFVSGGDLYFHLRRLQRFDLELVRKWLCELVLAIEYLHSMNIVYRDLKPENVLIDSQGHLHLADFGLSKQSESEDEALKTFCGTPYYVAPEMLTKNRRYTKGVDWWSLGVLCHELLVGQPPFYSGNVDRVYEKIAKDEIRFPGFVVEEPRKLIKALLQRDPKARLGAAKGGEELKQHEFFRGVDWSAVFEQRVETGFCPQNTEPQIPQPGLAHGSPPQQAAAAGRDDNAAAAAVAAAAAAAKGNFDPFFTRQRAADSFEQPVICDPADPRFAEFDGFSYRGTPASQSHSPTSSRGTSSQGTSGGSFGSVGRGRGSSSGSRGSPGGASGGGGSWRSQAMSDVASDSRAQSFASTGGMEGLDGSGGGIPRPPGSTRRQRQHQHQQRGATRAVQ
jgi:serine/threonine protein kinase